MEEYDNYVPQDKTSKFNSGSAQLFRIDNLWQSATHYARLGAFGKWNWALDQVWVELAPDASPIEIKQFKNINITISKYMKNKARLYNELLFKAIFLKKIQNGQGKGTAYIDPDDDMLED